jgi:hypothetical protein
LGIGAHDNIWPEKINLSRENLKVALPWLIYILSGCLALGLPPLLHSQTPEFNSL